jgi:phosphoglycolate phosphatase-like HAD superfamily hydrolase
VVLVTYGYNHGQPVRAVDADGFVDTLADIDLRAMERKTGLAPR